MSPSAADIFADLTADASAPYGPAPESDAEARAWLSRHEGRLGAFIGGEWRETAETFETQAPASGDALARVALCGSDEVNAAVDAARDAQGAWWGMGGATRARHLYALARTVQRNARLLAVVEALDNGKPIRETRDIDIPLAARHFYHHAGWAAVQEEAFPDHVPHGVAGQIIPWNFPLLMLAWKIAPALALGNTVVLKPAEQTPLTALLFAELSHAAGLPPGVLNVVPGLGETGALVAAHKGIDKIAFTGSTAVGRMIRQATAGSGKALTLELGGKSPFIVFDDADLDAAVEGVVDAIWFNQGEVCCAGSRLLVQEGVADAFRERLLARMERLRVGDPLDKSIDMGAMVSAEERARVAGLITQAVDEGASLHQPSWANDATGAFLAPTLLTEVEPADTVARDEIFGPVAVMMSFRTPAEAVQLANNSRYGLAASVWSETIGQALDLAPRLEAGIVWVNATNLLDAGAPFGGVRESGFGREGGEEGCHAYLRPKAWSGEPAAPRKRSGAAMHDAGFDRTPKLYIAGKQGRPDGGYSKPVMSVDGRALAEAPLANRKDVRNAVEAARKNDGWTRLDPHARAQILYYLAENMSARRTALAARLEAQTETDGAAEADEAIARLTRAAAWADKLDGRVQAPPKPSLGGSAGLALALREPLGVVGAVAPEAAPLLGAISLLAPLLAMGNRAVLVLSGAAPLVLQDLTELLETSDVPAGAVSLLTGDAAELAPVLADHMDIEALWCFADDTVSAECERRSAGNLKPTLTGIGKTLDWLGPGTQGLDWMRAASRTKTVWIPYGA